MNDSTPTHQPEASAEVERLRAALADVVDTDWAYLGRDADTGNPDSLYNRIRRGRAALATQPPSPPAQVGTSGASAEVAALTDAAIDELARQWANGSPVVLCYDGEDRPIDGWEFSMPRFRSAVRSALATMFSPAAKVGTEDADAQARLIAALLAVQMNAVCIPDTPGEQAISTATLKKVEDALGAYSLTIPAANRKTLMVTACCGRAECGGECGNEWAGMQPPEAMAPAAPVAAVGEAVAHADAEAQLSTLRDQVARLERERDQQLRMRIEFGDIISNHCIAMQSALIEWYGSGTADSGMQWIENTLSGPGLLPDMKEASALGGAQAWFDAKTAEHDAFRAANPGPAPARPIRTHGALPPPGAQTTPLPPFGPHPATQMRGAKPLDVEKVMLLVEAYAEATSDLGESRRSRSRSPRLVNRHDLRVHVAFKAAREALRSALAGE